MEKCPVELLIKIARFACTDGGYTGCSLSLVSHHIRDATKPARYLSVALTSPDRVRSFGSVVERADGSLNIKHLFVSFDLHASDSLSPAFLDDGGPKMAEDEVYFAIRHSVMQDSFLPILRMAAPTLITLFFDELRFNNVMLGDPYPHLRDLCVCRLSPSKNSVITAETTPFPSLTRLLITNSGDYLSKLAPWQALAKLAPNVSHIRLVDAESFRTHAAVTAFFHAYLNIPYPDDLHPQREPVSTAAQLGSLRSVQINPPAPSMYADNTYIFLSYGDLRRLAQEGKERGGDRVMSVDSATEYKSPEAWADWQNLLDGGDGPWVIPDRSRKRNE